jgi:hypothetical protein
MVRAVVVVSAGAGLWGLFDGNGGAAVKDWFVPPASRNLRRHGDSQTVVQLAFLGMSVAFWAAAKLRDAPVMDERIYGKIVGAYPAEWWAASIMIASTVYLAGIIINGSWRWSAGLRLLGAVWHGLTLSLFTYGGATAEYGDPIMIWGGTALGMHLLFIGWNIGDFSRAVQHGG